MTSGTILGVSCDFHDAAAALVVDGEVVAAVEEERRSRIKHDSSVPSGAIASCLAIAEIAPDDLDAVVLYEKPLRVISRNLAARQSRGPSALTTFVAEFPVLLRRNLMVGYRIDTELRRLGAASPPPVLYAEHHLSHAAAAFYPSPFDNAAVITVDGVGEWSTATIGQGVNHRVEQLVEQRFPHSLGLLYSLATAWCGFTPNDGEYKLMGLAPFGEPRFVDALGEVVVVHHDGSISVDARAVGWWSRRPSRLRRLVEALDGPPRGTDEPLDQRHADIARSVQVLVETAMLRTAEHAQRLTGARNLCLAGGVALNAVANGRLLREGPFDDIWVQPAAGDAGSAIGAALWYWHEELSHERVVPIAPKLDAMAGALLGPRFSGDEVAAWLGEESVAHRRYDEPAALDRDLAAELDRGAIVGWFQGRMEFGPRALGNRSILADPRRATVHRTLNERVKGRESFRPFAPAVLWEEASAWFDLDRPLPYMTVVVPVAASRLLEPPSDEGTSFEARAAAPRSEIPACTHVDGTARVQTVHRELNPRFHQLLAAFFERTACPVLLNTSFNVAGEPIVCTPEDALATARRAGLDILVLEDCWIDLRDRMPESDPASDLSG